MLCGADHSGNLCFWWVKVCSFISSFKMWRLKPVGDVDLAKTIRLNPKRKNLHTANHTLPQLAIFNHRWNGTVYVFFISLSLTIKTVRERSEAWVSNIRPVGQNRLGKDSSPAHWTALENYEEGMNFGLFFACISVLQLSLVIKKSSYYTTVIK